jgi:hypothetical protein
MITFNIKIMRKISIAALILSVFVISFSCKKSSDKPTNPPFASDTTMVEVDYKLFTTYKGTPYSTEPESMAYDSVNNCIYLYKPLSQSTLTGFEILQYNVGTKSLVSVYVNSDATWANSNGSEGMRLFFYNNELWVPGGATNDKIVRLSIGNNSVTFMNTYNVGTMDFGTKKGDNPYDIAQANGYMYIVSMNNYVYYASYSSLTTGAGNFATSATSHGSSIIAVNIANVPYLMVKCGDDDKLELYSTSGTYVRGVPINNSNATQLVKDSKQRVYFYDAAAKKIIRYSADLLTKEEFPVLNFNTYYYGCTLKEEKDRVTIYCRNSDGIGKVTLKK